MSKKNIIKLNEQYFSCNPINENFDDTNSSFDKSYKIQKKVGGECSSNPAYWSDEQRLRCARRHDYNQPNLRGGICMTNPEYWSDETRMKCTDDNKKDSIPKNKVRTRLRSKKRSKRRSKRKSKRTSKKKSSKKSKEGFCAGNTCLSEDNLKSLIKLLKKLELKK